MARRGDAMEDVLIHENDATRLRADEDAGAGAGVEEERLGVESGGPVTWVEIDHGGYE